MAYPRSILGKQKSVGYFSNEDLGLRLNFQFNPTPIQYSKGTKYNIEDIPGLDEQVVTWVSGGPFRLTFQISFDGRAVNEKLPFAAGPRVPLGAFNSAVESPEAIARTVINAAPGATPIRSLASRAKQIAKGIPLGKNKEIYEDLSRYETLDGKDHDSSIGVRPHIAILETFLRPKNLDLVGKAATFAGLGSMKAQLELAAKVTDQGSSRRFVAPPDCFFHYGTRVFRTKMESAPITETIHNSELTPTRIDANITLLVLEVGDKFESHENKRIVDAINFSNKVRALI